jgi:hypothetical protein
MAELNLLNESGQVMPRTGWKVSADSQELGGENGAVDDEEVALTHCHILLFRWKGAPAGGRGQCCIGVRVDWCTKPMTRVANGSGTLYHN